MSLFETISQLGLGPMIALLGIYLHALSRVRPVLVRLLGFFETLERVAVTRLGITAEELAQGKATAEAEVPQVPDPVAFAPELFRTGVNGAPPSPPSKGSPS